MALALVSTLVVSAAAAEPVVYTVRFPALSNHLAEVEAVYPAYGRTLELMMPIWSPGYYRVEDYTAHLRNFTVETPDGAALPFVQPRKNRWQINARGAPSVCVRYQLVCEGRSVTSDWVGDDYAVLNGAASFPALMGDRRRAYEVKLELPSHWNRATSALESEGPESAARFRAADYDTLVDSPILAGRLAVRQFHVGGVLHEVVDAGAYDQWDTAQEVRDLERMVRCTRTFWGRLPFDRFVFLNVFRKGAGGLEHGGSTLLTSSPADKEARGPSTSWLAYATHEYFHAFNAKRLRPVELSELDYERPPVTSGLWVVEGLTTYYGELLPCRAGMRDEQDFRDWLSRQIAHLQASPGRLVQSLADASRQVWSTPTSGLARDTDDKTVSYYNKGPIVGFLLDARIQHVSEGRRSLDDVMRLAFQRYSGARGFTEGEFRQTAEQVAGVDLKKWFQNAVFSPGELDYTEALEWFGLQFGSGEASAESWQLELRPDVTSEQRAHWRKLTEPRVDTP